MKTIDKICDILEEAHNIFSTTSIMDVMDLDKLSAQKKLIKLYGKTDKKNVDRYLELVDELKSVTQ